MLKKILAVDDEPNNLQLLRQILKGSYQLVFATNARKGLEAARQHRPDLILLDISMPDMDGYQLCRELKALPETQAIPVIFVTAMESVDDEALGFDVGAVDYIQKPVSAPIVLRRIQTHLMLVKAREVENRQREAIFMLGEAGHYNDTDTGAHIWRMAAYARALALAAGWSAERADMLELAAPMHDTGKIGIPDDILKFPGRLSPEQWDVMKRHTDIGYEILRKSDTPLFVMAAEVALRHHERWDGSGYPDALAGDAIPESARIVAIADVFDALTTRRPYKEPWSMEAAVAEIAGSAGSHFAPDYVGTFVSILPEIRRIRDTWQG
ncbi:response regulator [Paludibacterium paludis]|uniref:Two-component system response regulator n=1 Tax=Paludibacterium paludis TaxID=1225769 RepID=A0A918P389_9NEIS|nr:HD domain-containing phosphohydrolase [Paludibacterium paludis]GGY13991.1 two-component system response regulator [Paludibacterium paludis]